MTPTPLPTPHSSTPTEQQRRWRLILGGGAADGICVNGNSSGNGSGDELRLSPSDQAIDKALSALYDSDRQGGLGASSPRFARWLGDIRAYFPTSVVKVMQQDALERLNLRQLLLEPEMLEAVEPDVHLEPIRKPLEWEKQVGRRFEGLGYDELYRNCFRLSVA